MAFSHSFRLWTNPYFPIERPTFSQNSRRVSRLPKIPNWNPSEIPMKIYSYGHLPVITGYFYGIIHSINGVSSVLITDSHGHENCRIPWRICFCPTTSKALCRVLKALVAGTDGRCDFRSCGSPKEKNGRNLWRNLENEEKSWRGWRWVQLAPSICKWFHGRDIKAYVTIIKKWSCP